ncbi:BON domain-containing protein [Streptomyces sp. NPDC017179]|uniref:BON domain-containing protein n=1 Tax=Streptomyces sp. NPDC017179 TaxID=3364979 RepID=UPI00379C21AD
MPPSRASALQDPPLPAPAQKGPGVPRERDERRRPRRRWAQADAGAPPPPWRVRARVCTADRRTRIGRADRRKRLRVFLRRDEAGFEEITRDVLARTLKLTPADVTVAVSDGRVSLKGTVQARSLVAVIERLCGGVDDVVSVSSDIVYRSDDTGGHAGRG